MDFSAAADRCNRSVRLTFGEAVTYTPGGGSPVALRAPLDEAYAVVELQAGVPVTSLRPVLDVRLADLAALPLQGDQFTRAKTGHVYEVAEVQIEGNGTAKLICLKVS